MTKVLQRLSRAGLRGRAREGATLGVHPLSWLLSNNRLEEVCGTLTKGTFSSQLLLSNQDKGCARSVAQSLPLPPGFCSTCQLLLPLVPKGVRWNPSKKTTFPPEFWFCNEICTIYICTIKNHNSAKKKKIK